MGRIPPRPAKEHRIVWINHGSGVFQVDFRNYSAAGERVIFLAPGQYFTVVAGSFSIRELGIPAGTFERRPGLDTACRVLFTHVYEAGAISPSGNMRADLDPADADATASWLVDATRRWMRQKPLHPSITPDETNLIFDLRQLIESDFRHRRSVDEFAGALGLSARSINRITTSRINRTIGDLRSSRRLLEAQRELVFSDKTVQEIAYELDFSDPSYFSRFFSNATGMPPGAFRASQSSWSADPFLEELTETIARTFRKDRSVAFLADRFNLTPKALSARVRKLTGRPVTSLVRDQVVSEARRLLGSTDMSVQEIAWDLGFEEPSHFSRFFKNATGESPSVLRG